MHGASASQVRAAAAVRVEERETFARVLAAAPRRHPDEVLGDVVHVFDVLARESLDQLAAKVTGEQYIDLLERWERAGRWATTALERGVRERLVQVQEQESALVGRLLESGLRWLFDGLGVAGDPRIGMLVPTMLRALASAARAGEHTLALPPADGRTPEIGAS
jgi:hypothetical protein